jgi:hypothetical protein
MANFHWVVRGFDSIIITYLREGSGMGSKFKNALISNSKQQLEIKAMQLSDFIQDYLGDKDEGLKALITFFLNLVMQHEAEQQAGAEILFRDQ